MLRHLNLCNPMRISIPILKISLRLMLCLPLTGTFASGRCLQNGELHRDSLKIASSIAKFIGATNSEAALFACRFTLDELDLLLARIDEAGSADAAANAVAYAVDDSIQATRDDWVRRAVVDSIDRMQMKPGKCIGDAHSITSYFKSVLPDLSPAQKLYYPDYFLNKALDEAKSFLASRLTPIEIESITANRCAPSLWFDEEEGHYPEIPGPFLWVFDYIYDFFNEWKKLAPDTSWLNQKISPQLNRKISSVSASKDPRKEKPMIFWDKGKVSISDFLLSFESLFKVGRLVESPELGGYAILAGSPLREMVYGNDSLNVFRYWQYYSNYANLPPDIEIIYVFVRPPYTESECFSPSIIAAIGTKNGELFPQSAFLDGKCEQFLVEKDEHSLLPDYNMNGLYEPEGDHSGRWEFWGSPSRTRDSQSSWRTKAGLDEQQCVSPWLAANGSFVIRDVKLSEEIFFPFKFKKKISYDAYKKSLIFLGPMSSSEKDELLTLSEDDNYRKAIRELFKQSNKPPWSYHLFALRDLKVAYDKINSLNQFSIETPEDLAFWIDWGRCLERIGGPPENAWVCVSDEIRKKTSVNLINWLSTKDKIFWQLKQYTEDPLKSLVTRLFLPAHEKYAPALWFAKEEKYYPTIPFFTAFEWQDRTNSIASPDYSCLFDSVNIQKAREILYQQGAGEFFNNSQMLWPDRSWPALDSTYQSRIREQSIPQVWVFWDSTTISLESFEDIVKTDRQFWKRSKSYREWIQVLHHVTEPQASGDSTEVKTVEELNRYIGELRLPRSDRDRLFEELLNQRLHFHGSLPSMSKRLLKKIPVYRYWMYYLNDDGIEGHPQDIERTYVFATPNAADRTKYDPPLAIIGLAHKDWNANNVLLFPPEETNTDFHILIERGGHSCAPDLNGDGRFSPGFDANWRSENLWGTRDTQAASGSGALGSYQSWMTFPRYDTSKCMPPRLKDQSSWSYKLVSLYDLKQVYDMLATLSKTPTNSTSRQKLYESLEKIGGPPAEAWAVLKDSVRESTLSRLKSWIGDQWTYDAEQDDAEQDSEMLGKEKHMPWLHNEYKKPVTDAFKRHLFPSHGNFYDWLPRGFYVRKADKDELIGGIEFLTIEPPGLLKLPGVLVFDAGYRELRSKPDQFFGRLLYDTGYAKFFSGYLGGSIQTAGGEIFWSPNTEILIHAGLKAELYMPAVPCPGIIVWALPNYLQIRMGVRIPSNAFQLLGDQARLELQFGFHR